MDSSARMKQWPRTGVRKPARKRTFDASQLYRHDPASEITVLISARSNGQDKLEHRASRRIPGNPQSSAMSLDNRAANRQPHSHPFALAREERLEDAFRCLRFDSGACVLDGNDAFSGLGRVGPEP